MKKIPFSHGILFLIAVFMSSCAHTSLHTSSLDTENTPPLQNQEMTTSSADDEEITGELLDEDYLEEEFQEVSDPLYLWNKGMFYFNDKLYFWVLKPVARGYSYIIPEEGRILVSNFFKNITTPIRFVNNILQAKLKSAGTELARFVLNTTVGIVGFNDIAKKEFDMKSQDEDFGQTLGSYGIGHGVYIVWPFLGPSSIRDTVGLFGDLFLYPVSYINPEEVALGIIAFQRVNKTSLRIGDYEDFKKAAIDPYVALRDAYIQNRKKLVEE